MLDYLTRDALIRFERSLVSFIQGPDRSLSAANAMEAVLREHFHDDDHPPDLGADGLRDCAVDSGNTSRQPAAGSWKPAPGS